MARKFLLFASRMEALGAVGVVLAAAGCSGEIGDVTLTPAAIVARTEAQTVVGHWYLATPTQRLAVLIEQSPDHRLRGSVTDEALGITRPLAMVQYDPAAQRLTFRDGRDDGFRHVRMDLHDGVTTGRIAVTPSETAPDDPLAYVDQLTGWRDETFSAAEVPRVFDLVLADRTRAVLRLDRASPGAKAVGRFKIYNSGGVLDERLSEDIDVEQWDGRNLRFSRPGLAVPEHFVGVVSGRTITGTSQAGTDAARTFKGERGEVLTHGLVAHARAATLDWQARTRQRLTWLTMNGNPAPLSVQTTTLGQFDPLAPASLSGNRDDSGNTWPQSYQLTELQFTSTLPDPAGGPPLVRKTHAVLAVPTTPAPPGGYPVALALNGHWGSAWRVFDPDNTAYWYGDGFARRGFVVLAVDMSHRPVEDRSALYGDTPDGDDPENGNDSHPAIRTPELNSEWEEDGERAWDALRGLDHLLARTDVDRQRVTVLGLSMGAEISEWVAAMDGRATAVVVASGPPDLAVLQYHGNHPCWGWLRGNIREYLDPSDLDALVAPRTLVRETGRQDGIYSNAAAPFASAKQVVRRAQPTFDVLGGRLIHYLHYDGHGFHIGEQLPDAEIPLGVTTPVAVSTSPTAPWSTAWQTDETTSEMAPSLFDEVPR